MLNNKPYILCPKARTLNPKPSAFNDQPETFDQAMFLAENSGNKVNPAPFKTAT
jgi:hypothetical protein